MGFCIKCGSTLAEGAHFCGNCGVEIGEAHTESGQRKTVYDGEVYKCPNCAEILNSFMPFCPSCGYELRGAKGASVVKEFAEKLEKIEKTREIPKRDFFTGILAVLDEEKLNKTDEGKINLIRSFSIPNTKEDILEFMILAASNIDLKLYGKENTAGINSPQRSISDAWLAKFEQAYEKAKFSFYGYPDIISGYICCSYNIGIATRILFFIIIYRTRLLWIYLIKIIVQAVSWMKSVVMNRHI